MNRAVLIFPVAFFVFLNYAPAQEKDAPKVSAPPDVVFEKYRKDDREVARKFYKKYLDVKGIAVLAAEEVADGRVRVPKGKRRVAASKGRPRTEAEQDDLSAADFQ